MPLLRVLALQRRQRRAPHHRDVVARKLVGRQQLAHLQLDQVQQLRVVDHVDLVHVHHQRRHPDLARQQDVLAGLRHRPVRRRHHQDRPIHLRRPGDHVLDVVGMARAVDMRVMPVRRLVLDMRRRDRDPARPLLRRLVDLVERHKRRPARFRQDLGDRRRQRRLAVVDVTNRPDVAVRLRPLKLRLRHRFRLSVRNREHKRTTETQPGAGAGDGNRTHVASLEGWSSTIELHPRSARTRRPDPLPPPAPSPDPPRPPVARRRKLARWWRGLDSNQRRRTSADLQSAAFNHSATPPGSRAARRSGNPGS